MNSDWEIMKCWQRGALVRRADRKLFRSSGYSVAWQRGVNFTIDSTFTRVQEDGAIAKPNKIAGPVIITRTASYPYKICTSCLLLH